jgi:spore germination protein GerM
MKLQLPHSARPDILSGLVLFLAVGGGLTWSVWRLSSSNFVMQSGQSRVEQPSERLPEAAPTAIAPQLSQGIAPRTNAASTITPLPSSPSQAPRLKFSEPQPVLEPAAQVYWLQARGNQIAMVPVEMSRMPQRSDGTVLTEALNYLLARPQIDSLNSTIPSGTRLLSLQVQPTGINVDLSKEFTVGGGSASMTYRVAQVLYTVTSLNPQAKVYLSVEGTLLNEDNPLGGEGLMLQQPLTRQQFVTDFLSQE